MGTIMMNHPPYEGDKDYIFVSYSHQDIDRVVPLLQGLQDAGYRLWFDEGIDPGTEWPESIAQHLARCRVCLAFISATSVDSYNCRREINYALSKKKEFLSVMLEPTEMSPGMEMQITTYQYLAGYRYKSVEQLVRKLCSLDILAPCKEQQAATEANTSHEEASIPSETAEDDSARRDIKKETKVEQEFDKKYPKAICANKKNRKTENTRTGNVKRTRLSLKGKKSIIALILAVALLVVALLFAKPFRRTATINGKRLENQSYLTISDADISKDISEKLARLDKCQSLTFTRCSFESGALDNLAILDLHSLKLSDCTGVDSLRCLQSFENLSSLSLDNSGITDELLKDIEISEKLSDISIADGSLTRIPFSNKLSQIRSLSLPNNNISEMTALSEALKLTSLDLTGNRISDLTALSRCVKIEKLLLSDNAVHDLTGLEELVYLKTLSLAGNGIGSIAPISNCTILAHVELQGNPAISDLSILEKNTDTLSYLDISGIRNADLAFLKSCTKLKTLNVNSCGLKDIQFAFAMSSLEVLNAADNEIVSLAPIAHLSALRVVNLSYNLISSLEGMPSSAEESRENNKLVLLLHHNQLTRLDFLDSGFNYSLLTIYGNSLNEGASIAEVEGSYLIAEMSDVFEPAELKGFTKIYLTTRVLDRQVAWESELGSRCSYVAEDAVPDIIEQTSYDSIILYENAK